MSPVFKDVPQTEHKGATNHAAIAAQLFVVLHSISVSGFCDVFLLIRLPPSGRPWYFATLPTWRGNKLGSLGWKRRKLGVPSPALRVVLIKMSAALALLKLHLAQWSLYVLDRPHRCPVRPLYWTLHANEHVSLALAWHYVWADRFVHSSQLFLVQIRSAVAIKKKICPLMNFNGGTNVVSCQRALCRLGCERRRCYCICSLVLHLFRWLLLLNEREGVLRMRHRPSATSDPQPVALKPLRHRLFRSQSTGWIIKPWSITCQSLNY